MVYETEYFQKEVPLSGFEIGEFPGRQSPLGGLLCPPFPNQRSLGVGFTGAFPSAQEAQFIGLHSVGTPVGFGAKKVHY